MQTEKFDLTTITRYKSTLLSREGTTIFLEFLHVLLNFNKVLEKIIENSTIILTLCPVLEMSYTKKEYIFKLSSVEDFHSNCK